jgi:hypothetical protein
MKDDTWRALEDLFKKYPIMRASSVPGEEIDIAEAEAGVRLSSDYRDFVSKFGGAVVGPYSVFGLRQADAMGPEECSFLEITRKFRAQGWPGVNEWAVISMDHAGNPIGMSEDGRIWCSDHDAGQIFLVAPTFEDYLRSRCLELD